MSPSVARQKQRVAAARERGDCIQCCKMPAEESQQRCARCKAFHVAGVLRAQGKVDIGPSSRGEKVYECECGRAKTHRRAVSCMECARIERIRREADTVAHRASVQLKHWDGWALAVDLRIALDMNDDEGGALSAELGRLARAGRIERRVEPKMGIMYRARRAA